MPAECRGLAVRAVLIFVVLAALPGALPAKVPPQWTALGDRPGDRMMAEYFRLETARLRDACLADVHSADDWNARRDECRRQLHEMLGLDPMAPRTDLKPVVTGRVEADGVVVEKLHFQSRPGLYVTGNLYLPKEVKGPMPGILYVCGHGGVKKDGVSYGNKCHYQHHGTWFARHGYACLVIDSLQLGEIEAIHHGTYREGMWWWNSYGYTPAGVEAWNCVRALDYLQTRKEVDPQKLGVTGRSGGGAYSWWIAAIDERIKAAVPVAGITDLQNHVVDGCVEGHCDCMFMVNTYQWDYPMVAALVAPRPLLIGNTDDDSIFPLDGVKRVYEKAGRIYELCGARDKIGLAVFPGPHKDLPELQKAAFAFFDKHLKGIERDPGEVDVKPFQPEQLKVFKELPADQINTKVQEQFVRLAPEPKVPESKDEWKLMTARWTAALMVKTFRAWPEKPEPLDVKEAWSAEREGVRLAAYDFTSQGPVRLRLFVVHRAGLKQAKSVVFNLLGDEDAWHDMLDCLRVSSEKELAPYGPFGAKQQDDTAAWLKGIAESDAVMVCFAPRGVGPTAFNPDKKKQTQIRRRFMLLGETLEGMQVWDARRAIQAARSLAIAKGATWALSGDREGSGLALYAALFEPPMDQLSFSGLAVGHREGLPPIATRQEKTEVRTPGDARTPARIAESTAELVVPGHPQGPALLNVRRFLDVPEALAMVVARSRVRLVEPNQLDRTYPKRVLKALGLDPRRLDQGLFPAEVQHGDADRYEPKSIRSSPDRQAPGRK